MHRPTMSSTGLATPEISVPSPDGTPQPASPSLTAPSIWRRLQQARERPKHAVETLIALGKGYWYKGKYRLLGRRFRAGRHFRVYNRIRVEGPGEVVLGDYVLCERNVSFFTYSSKAKLEIGNRVNMGGTQFGCVRSIRIGYNSVLADANIMDSDFHSIFANRRQPDAPVRVKPVDIGENVWICGRVAILAGTKVGDNSVVGFGAVCARDYPANSLVSGNPGKVVGSVPERADPTRLNPEQWISQQELGY